MNLMNLNLSPAFYLVLSLVVSFAASQSEDLYDVLGVSKSATHQEIRKAYKNLAKEWHPDKNKDPEATNKFTKINEAYETLGDSERRHQYDHYGYTTAQEPNRQRQGDFGQFFNQGPFGGGFRFKFQNSEAIFDKYLLTLRAYETRVFPESHTKPYIIYAYSDFCFQCMRMEHIIERFFKELEPIGFGLGAIHAGMNQALTSHLRLTEVPAIMGLSKGRMTFLRGTVNIHTLREFARGLFPGKLGTPVTDESLSFFLSGWTQDNRVRALFFSRKEMTPGRLLLAAFANMERVNFGYVWVNSPGVQDTMTKYGVDKSKETLLMFKEDPKSPTATVSMHQIPKSTLDEVVDSNKFLTLPRLSSQGYFDDLCPESESTRRRKLCVVLVTRQSSDHDFYRSTFRKLSRSTMAFSDRVKFLYMYEDIQKSWVESLAQGRNVQTNQSALKVAIIWRLAKQNLNYEWLETGWPKDKLEQDHSGEVLKSRLKDLLNSQSNLPHRTRLPELYNEHALGLFRRILDKFIDWWERITYYFMGYDSATWSMVLFSCIMVFLIGVMMQRMMVAEETSVQRMKPQRSKPRPPNRTDENKVYVHPLRVESYDTLVRQADTGLTITLLVDLPSRDKLLQKFVEIMFPHSRYSGLTFAFLQLEHYLGWYRAILEESMENRVSLTDIKIRNCVGTVLAVNGFRRYFYLYHPKRARQYMRSKKKINVGRAMGLYDTDDSSTDEEPIPDAEDNAVPLFEENLLDGLTNWMDRVFDGSVKKIRVPEWPEIEL